MPVHDDVQFSTPIPRPSDPLLEDRTQPFPTNSFEVSNDLERQPSPPIVTHHTEKGYSERYVHVTKWMALLTIGYMLNRIVAILNVPYDVQHHTWLGHCRNVIDMYLMGFMQCWFVELIDSESRWQFLLSDAWFVTLFLVTGPCFSILTTLPGFDQSLGEDADMSTFFIVVLSITGLVLVYLVWWHVVYSKRTLRSTYDFAAFWLFRGATLAVLALLYHLIHADLPTIDGPARLHLHHYFLAWFVSTIAAFNHRISSSFLAVTTGVFVQGVSVYSAASMFHRGPHELICPEMKVH